MKSDQPMSLRDGMIFGGIWSVASIGWIAGIALIIAWFRSGWDHALFWFGLILLLGAGLFAFIVVISLVCEALNVTTKRSRRDALNYFGWAFLYNLVLGSIALFVSLTFGSLEADQGQGTERSEQGVAVQPAAAEKSKAK